MEIGTVQLLAEAIVALDIDPRVLADQIDKEIHRQHPASQLAAA